MDRAGPEEHARISLGLFHLLFDAIGVRQGAAGAGSTAVPEAATAAGAGAVGLDSSASEEVTSSCLASRPCELAW